MIHFKTIIRHTNNPAFLKLGLSLFLLFAINISATPKIGLTISNNANGRQVNIYVLSLGPLKSGVIECEYAPLIDLDHTYLGSPVSSLSLGASINKADNKILIFLDATSSLTIDSATVVTMEIPFSDIESWKVLTLLSASFTTPNGDSCFADIIPPVKTKLVKPKNKTCKNLSSQHFLLDGRCISGKTLNCYQKRAVNLVPHRYLNIKK